MRKRAQALLRPEFLERLRALKDQAFRIFRKREMRGLATGQAPEFDTHRSYEPGDEPRYIDWNIYARLEKLLLKVYVVDEEIQIAILVDVSSSMRAGGGRKSRMASEIAAAFTYLGLVAGHNVVLGAFADGVLATRGPFRSLRHFPDCLHFFANLPEGQGTDLGRGLAQFASGRSGRSLVLVVSDFFQEKDVVREMDWVLWKRSELHVVRVVDDEELAPVLRGEYAVLDAEGRGKLNLSLGDDLLHAWRKAVDGHVREVETACRQRSIPHLLARTSQDVEDLVLEHLLGQVERAR